MSQKENVLLRYEPFRLEIPKVSREEEGVIEGEELQRILDRLYHSLDPIFEGQNDNQIDLALHDLAILSVEALAMRANKGHESASAQLHHVIRSALRDYGILIDRGNKKLVQFLQHAPAMPGYISLNSNLTRKYRERAERVGVGSKYPFPKGKPLTAQNLLATEIFEYVMGNKVLPRLLPDWLDSIHGEVHPMRLRMIEISDLTTETIDEWMALARDILRDTTDGEFEAFDAFNNEPYKAMNQPGKFWDRLREGFKAKAIGLQQIKSE